MLLGVILPLRAAPEGVYSSPLPSLLAVVWLGTHNALPTPLVSAAPVHQWDLGHVVGRPGCSLITPLVLLAVLLHRGSLGPTILGHPPLD